MARGLTLACVCLLAVAMVATAGGAGTSGAGGTADGGAASHGNWSGVPASDAGTAGAPATTADGTTDSNAAGESPERTEDGDRTPPNRTDDQPGDVVSIPVGMADNETEATVVLANESLGYRLEVRVLDANRDGVVTLRWNTYHAGVVPADAVANRTVGTTPPDRVVEVRRTTPRTDARLPEGNYTLQVSHDGRVVATDSVVLESDPLRRSSITVLEGPPLGDPSAALARSGISDSVELDEWLFVLVERPGIHGYVDGMEDLTGNGTEGVTFRIVRASDGEPADLSNAVFLHFPEHDEFVVGVPPNATVLDADTDYVARFVVDRSNPYAAGVISSSTDIRVLRAGAQPDRPVLEVVDVTAPGTVIEGRNVTFDVAVVNSGEREGTATVALTVEGVRVTRQVTVGPRSQNTASVRFDTSPLTEGTTRWYVHIEGGARNVSGELEVRLTNETHNEEPTLVPGPRREGDGGQPGFGVLASLVGLGIGGRVLAHRRE